MKNSAYLQELAAHVLTTDAGKVTLVFDDSLALRRMSVDQARELAQCLLDAASGIEREEARAKDRARVIADVAMWQIGGIGE